ncbi:MAG: TlpA family protein disulfide reductase [Rudaea sp.]|uniref:TlpA family protein disulfide reductase n=1 Tax=unclassified Rudaea TaxID=2627037 RepID=UPI0010F91517|nr:MULTISPECIES: TlpA disulfide reductase family protein [unclassified Rudaea]MBN8886047.1 TlpA family protein disulfide reductase [Rudaea sp.]MBR0345662.1 TlpA family protein disulfide reductase [Rudaea sp.]
MFNRSNLIIVAVAIFGAALGLFASSRMGGYADKPVPPGVTVLKIGDTRADLELTDLEGKPRRLSEFDGKFVLLNFWATWCGPCREEMPLLDATHEKLADKNVRVVGIAIDDGEAVRDFLKQYPVRYPILLGSDEDDPSLRFGDTKSVLPYSVLIAPDGKLLAQRAGYFSEETLAHWLAPHLPPS